MVEQSEKKVKKKKENVAEQHVEKEKPTHVEPHKSKEQEYLELAQRIKAEFENYKRRNAEITTQSFDNGVMFTVEKLLPAIDSFKQAKQSISDENVLKGLDLVLSQILKAFEDLGVSKIDAVHKPFDPNLHNAVLATSDPDIPDGEIVQELQEGFIYKGDKVIRHSVVQINKLS